MRSKTHEESYVKRIVSTEMVVLAGLLAVPAVADLEHRKGETAPPVTDPRLFHLHKFFAAHNSPLKDLAPEFLIAADKNDLDWRLLPSISLVESSAGKFYRNNNVFGWDSCHRRFPSVRASIHMVAAQLGTSPRYRDKSVSQILSIYNPRPEYSVRVKSVMRTIGALSLAPN
jgi:hypothetical protein